jgi:hypothetical protein
MRRPIRNSRRVKSVNRISNGTVSPERTMTVSLRPSLTMSGRGDDALRRATVRVEHLVVGGRPHHLDRRHRSPNCLSPDSGVRASPFRSRSRDRA